MSVIFQLFKATDLQMLTLEQLAMLKITIRDALHTPANISQQIQNRAYEVFRQLKGRDPRPGQPAQSKPILLQLFSEQELQTLDPKEFDILEMAISCEVANAYESLEAIKALAHNKFRELTQQQAVTTGLRPNDPDSSYSPFNPASKLYPIYNPPPP
jgi:hypothetical protein